MCGRFVLISDLSIITEYFNIQEAQPLLRQAAMSVSDSIFLRLSGVTTKYSDHFFVRDDSFLV